MYIVVYVGQVPMYKYILVINSSSKRLPFSGKRFARRRFLTLESACPHKENIQRQSCILGRTRSYRCRLFVSLYRRLDMAYLIEPANRGPFRSASYGKRWFRTYSAYRHRNLVNRSLRV